MARAYDVIEVEKKWQQRWADEGTYEVDAGDPRPPWYVLTMYPYPSGPAHMGHVRNYTFGDLLVRHRTMLGYAVLSPFGFDSFGLPAENAAIRTGTHPRIFTDARIAELKQSITSLGAVYDWRREIRSHDPEYIRWNQVIFEKFLAAGPISLKLLDDADSLLQHGLLFLKIVYLLLQLLEALLFSGLLLDMSDDFCVFAVEQAPMNPQGYEADAHGDRAQNILQRRLDRHGGALRLRTRSPEQVDPNHCSSKLLSASPTAIARRGASSRI